MIRAATWRKIFPAPAAPGGGRCGSPPIRPPDGFHLPRNTSFEPVQPKGSKKCSFFTINILQLLFKAQQFAPMGHVSKCQTTPTIKMHKL
jgi:hypothetical protein